MGDKPGTQGASLSTFFKPPRVESSLEEVRVLVADDDADGREILVMLLHRARAMVTATISADEALAAVETTVPDVIVTDLWMPVHDGFWLLDRLRELPPHKGGRTPVVALTVSSDPRVARRAIAAGFAAFLARPVNLELFCGTVAELSCRKRGGQAPGDLFRRMAAA
jgi:CheY-like chemotaxis protein